MSCLHVVSARSRLAEEACARIVCGCMRVVAAVAASVVSCMYEVELGFGRAAWPGDSERG